MKIKILIFLSVFKCSLYVEASLFENHINEIQVYQDRVRVHISSGYGTCGSKDGWFGWSTSNERHKDWLSLVLIAKATKTRIGMYDQNDSCGGLSDAVAVEGVFFPAAE